MGNDHLKRVKRPISGYTTKKGKKIDPYRAHRHMLRNPPRKVILPQHSPAQTESTERPFQLDERQRPFKGAVSYNMRTRLRQPDEPARQMLDELAAEHPLLIGFTLDVPPDFNQYGVKIGKSQKRPQGFVASEVRNVRLIPIMAISERDLEDPERVRQIKQESEIILAKIDNDKAQRLFPEWQSNPQVQVFFNLDKRGEREHEIGLIDLEDARPGEAVKVQYKLVLKQKVDTRRGLVGPDFDRARRYIDNERVLVYHAKLKEYNQAAVQLDRERDPAKRKALYNMIYGNKQGVNPETGTLALEPYLKENYIPVLDVFRERGIPAAGNDAHFAKTKGGKYDHSPEGRLGRRDRKDAFLFQRTGQPRPLRDKTLRKELDKLYKENLEYGKQGDIQQYVGEPKFYTDSYTISPVARDLTEGDDDRPTQEKSKSGYRPFEEVIYQDIRKIRAIRDWQATEKADEKTRTKMWAIFVRDAIQQNITAQDKGTQRRLKNIKALRLNPMVMEESDVRLVETQLGITLPPKPKITKPLPLDYIEDQVWFEPHEVVARRPKAPEVETFPSPEPTEYVPPETETAPPRVRDIPSLIQEPEPEVPSPSAPISPEEILELAERPIQGARPAPRPYIPTSHPTKKRRKKRRRSRK